MRIALPPPVPALVAVALLAPAACQDSDGTGSEVTVRDSAGIPIVENGRPMLGPAQGWRVSQEPALRIGAVEGEEAEQLSQVTGVARLSDGRLAVLESQTREIRYFDASSAHLKTVGGQGGGPGEFNFASRMVRLPGDSILVEDRPRIRYVVFGPDGDLASEATLDMERFAPLGMGAECAYETLPDRSRIGCVEEPGGEDRVVTESGRSHIGAGLVRSHSRFVWVRPDLSGADTLGLYGGIEQYGIEVGGSVSYAVHPFHARTRTAVSTSPPRFFAALNPAYSIEVWAPGGVLERIIRRPGARRVPDAALDEAAREVVGRYARDDAQRNRFRTEMEVPDSLPAVNRLVAAPDGELWVGRTLAIEDGPAIYDVFDPEGRFVTTVELPARFLPFEAGGDYVLGVRLDETEVPFVELYTLERGSS